MTPSVGRFAKWAIDATAGRARPAGDDRGRLPRQPAARRRATGSAARRASSATSSSTCPPSSQVHRQVVRKDLDLATRRRRPVVPAVLRRGRRPRELGDVAERRGARCATRVGEQHGLRRRAGRRPRPAASVLHGVLGARHGEVTVAVHGRATAGRDRRRLARLRRRRLRHRHRRRLDDHRRTPLRPRHRRGARHGRADEPADPLRRGPDEPGVVRDDEPGRRPRADGRGAARDRRARRRARARPPARTRDRVLEVVLVGNPIMHHLVLGIDPDAARLGAVRARDRRGRRAGGPPSSTSTRRTPAGTPGRASPATSAPTRRRPSSPRDRTAATAMQLLVDVGTNAEIVLGNRARLFAASSPTGPAFEGAQISCGQRATAGAIERVRIDPETYEPRVRVIGCDAWSDEAGFADGASPACAARGSSTPSPRWSRAGVVDTDGTIRGELAEQHAAGRRRRPHVRLRAARRPAASGCAITQNDVRAIQLAKAALRAGIELLLEHAGRPELVRHPPRRGLRRPHRPTAGDRPRPGPGRAGVRSVGNAAGAGAVTALLSRAARAEMEAGRAHRDQDRDGHRAEVPGAVRHGDGVPPRFGAGPHPAAATEAGREDVTAGRRGRAARREARAAAVIEREPFLTRALAPVELVSTEGLELLEHNAETILEEVGVEIHDHPSTLVRFADAGADVDGDARPLPAGAGPPAGVDGAGAVPAARPQPDQHGAGRRRRDGVRTQLRLAVRARPRPRSALRHARRTSRTS